MFWVNFEHFIVNIELSDYKTQNKVQYVAWGVSAMPCSDWLKTDTPSVLFLLWRLWDRHMVRKYENT